VTSWNKAAERIFGYTAPEMIGQSIMCLAVPGHGDEMMEILERIRRGERVDHYEAMRRHKDGAILHISLSVSPIYDGDGRLIGTSRVSRDITGAKKAEATLKQSEARLQELNAELLHVSRLSAMGQVAAVVAHELNQPLTVITNYMEAARALLDHGGDLALPRIGSAMDRASEQAIRAGQIIQRLRGSCRAATASGGSRQYRH
jgi:PAS domain S-box-containing protein